MQETNSRRGAWRLLIMKVVVTKFQQMGWKSETAVFVHSIVSDLLVTVYSGHLRSLPANFRQAPATSVSLGCPIEKFSVDHPRFCGTKKTNFGMWYKAINSLKTKKKNSRTPITRSDVCALQRKKVLASWKLPCYRNPVLIGKYTVHENKNHTTESRVHRKAQKHQQWWHWVKNSALRDILMNHTKRAR